MKASELTSLLTKLARIETPQKRLIVSRERQPHLVAFPGFRCPFSPGSIGATSVRAFAHLDQVNIGPGFFGSSFGFCFWDGFRILSMLRTHQARRRKGRTRVRKKRRNL
jgi:hypothetical protein